MGTNGNGTGLAGLAMHMSADLAPPSGSRSVTAEELKPEIAVEPATSKAYLQGASHTVKTISRHLRELCQMQDSGKREESALELIREVGELKVLLASGKMNVLTTFVSCLGRIVSSFKDTQKSLNPSVLRTTTNAVDLLRQTLDAGCDCREVEKSPLRLMVVDDDAVCRRAMSLALSSGDLRLAVCENGVQALEKLREETYDAIFLDIMMPGVNGLVVARTIRGLPANSETPIVFVTCLSDFKTRSESILSGGCDLVGKPVSPAEIVVKAYTLALRRRINAGEIAGISTSPGTAARTAAPAALPNGKAVAKCLGVLHVNREGQIDNYDLDCFRMLGYAVSEVRGRQIDLLFPADLQTEDGIVSRLMCEKIDKPMEVIVHARRKDGSTARLKAAISAFFANQTSRMVFLKPAPEDAPEDGRAPAPIERQKTCAIPIQDTAPAVPPRAPTPPPAHSAQPVLSESPPSELVATPLPAVASPVAHTAGDSQALIASLEAKLREVSKALADAKMMLKIEQDCRAALEMRLRNTQNSGAGCSPAPPTPIDSHTAQTLQTQIASAREELEAEREKRRQFEAKVETLFATIGRQPSESQG